MEGLIWGILRYVFEKDGKMRKTFRRSSILTLDISKYHHFVLESHGFLALCLTLLHIIHFSLHFVDIFIENLLSKNQLKTLIAKLLLKYTWPRTYKQANTSILVLSSFELYLLIKLARSLQTTPVTVLAYLIIGN